MNISVLNEVGDASRFCVDPPQIILTMSKNTRKICENVSIQRSRSLERRYISLCLRSCLQNVLWCITPLM